MIFLILIALLLVIMVIMVVLAVKKARELDKIIREHTVDWPEDWDNFEG